MSRVRTPVLLAWALVAVAGVLVLSVLLLHRDDDDRGRASATTRGAEPSFVVTSPEDTSRRLEPVAASTGDVTSTVTVDSSRPQQTWWGTGAALTDASVELLTRQPKALDLLFDPGRSDGAHLDALRMPLTSTDLSPRAWTWGWDGTTATPSPEASAAISAVTEKIVPRQPDLKVVASPWSAPPSMKTGETVRGGGLRNASEASYAAMLAAQTIQLRERGVPVRALTLVNEPSHASDYPTMTVSVDQLARLAGRLAGKLPDSVSLWAGDDNWRLRSALDRLTSASSDFDGSAYHCYEGDPDQMDGPTSFRIITECTGTTDGWARSFSWQMRRLVTVPISRGSSGLLMWNLALDADHGPSDATSRGGCKTCRGLVTVDGQKVSPGPEFYVLAHVARAAPAGARVVPADSDDPDVSVAAFRRDDGSVGVVGINRGHERRTVALRVGGATRQYTVGAGELFTYVTPAP